MHVRAIIRVFCVDGPCRGLQYLDPDTGRVLFSEDSERLGLCYFYRVSATQMTHTDFGPRRIAGSKLPLRSRGILICIGLILVNIVFVCVLLREFNPLQPIKSCLS